MQMKKLRTEAPALVQGVRRVMGQAKSSVYR